MLVVIKPYRGKGIATELVTRSIREMMESGCEEVHDDCTTYIMYFLMSTELANKRICNVESNCNKFIIIFFYIRRVSSYLLLLILFVFSPRILLWILPLKNINNMQMLVIEHVSNPARLLEKVMEKLTNIMQHSWKKLFLFLLKFKK